MKQAHIFALILTLCAGLGAFLEFVSGNATQAWQFLIAFITFAVIAVMTDDKP